MDIKEVVHKYLLDNKYDGLCNPDLECGCELDDLFPCSVYGELAQECEPGYKMNYDEKCKEGCEAECARVEGAWCMRLKKEE